MRRLLSLDPDSLRMFVAVCEAGGITRVAKQEALVVSAVSKRLAQLESRLGVRLLDRSRSGVMPTPAGLTLLQHARAMLVLMDDIERDVTSHSHVPRGQVRVFAAAASLAESVPDDIASFLKEPGHAEIRISVEERLSHDVIEGVRRGAASLGICWDVVDKVDMHAVPYRTDHLGIAFAPGHELSRSRTITFAQTLRYPHIGLPAASNFQTTLRDAARSSAQTLRYRAVVTTFEAAARLAIAGAGVAIVPREVASKVRVPGRRTFAPLTDPWAKRQFIVCCRAYEELSTPGRLLFDHLTVCRGNLRLGRR